MAWFGRKSNDEKEPPKDGSNPPADNGPAGERVVFAPDKAARFFERAQAVHDTTNYEYAMQLWLNGLRQDPSSMRGLEAFFKSTAAFLGDSGGKPPSKETMKMFGGRGDVEKYLAALLTWGIEPLDAQSAVRAADAAAKLNLAEAAYWVGERALGAVAQEKKPRKDLFLKLVEIFTKIGAFDKAVTAGEAAVRVDPTDGRLAAEIRNLSAQATMSRGGFDQTGQAGGFRANIRDAEKQRQLEEAERIVKTDETLDRVLGLAEADYRSRPDDPAANAVYIQRLLERGRPEDLKRARDVAKRAYEVTKQFRFRQTEGDIVLRTAARKLAEYKDLAEKNPDSTTHTRNYQLAQQQFTKMELEEYKARSEAYPTDLSLKFELGRRYFQMGDMDNAIPLLQEAQHEARRRVESLNYLAQAFQKIDYIDEAVNTFRQALEAHKVGNDETGMGLRYGLLTALQAKAESERDLSSAEEADKIASSIAIQQFNFRDIRARRDTLKKLIVDLKRGDTAPA